MKLYSLKHHRYVERQIHFGIGNSVKAVCGIRLYSRKVLVSLFSDNDGSIVTDDFKRVTCKRCLATKEVKIRNLIAIEKLIPGIFNRDSLCGEEWLLKNALNINRETIDAQTLIIDAAGQTFTLSNQVKSKDRKDILRSKIKVRNLA